MHQSANGWCWLVGGVFSKGEKYNNAINRRSCLCLKGHRLQHRLRGYGIIPLIRMGFNKSPLALQHQGHHLSVSAGELLSGSSLATQTGPVQRQPHKSTPLGGWGPSCSGAPIWNCDNRSIISTSAPGFSQIGLTHSEKQKA